jgi:hypothetical protein
VLYETGAEVAVGSVSVGSVTMVDEASVGTDNDSETGVVEIGTLVGGLLSVTGDEVGTPMYVVLTGTETGAEVPSHSDTVTVIDSVSVEASVTVLT